ncbi:TPA: calmodulin-like 3 [Trebouxia sp. C0004]
MSSPQGPALQEAFNTFDEDGSGFVDLQELIRCLRSLNVNHVTDAQIERRFKEADVDSSGAIDFAEFYGLWFSLTRPNEVTLQEVKDILRKRVVDRTGAQLQRLAKFLQQKQPFFQQLQPEVVHDVARFLLYDHIKAGTILMKQGDKGDHMYIILSGQANIHIANTTSFKNVVHAIQHTRMLAKLVSGNAASRAHAEASSSDSATQGSHVKQPSTARLLRNPSLRMQQEEVQVQAKEDATVTQAAANANVTVPDPHTTTISAQAGDAMLAKADAGRKPSPSRLSRFGQDSLAASSSTEPEVKAGTDAAVEQPDKTGLPGQSMPVQTLTLASALHLGGQQSRLSGKGIGRLVASLGPGDALGEMALLKQGGLRTATVQTTTDCEVAAAPLPTHLSFIHYNMLLLSSSVNEEDCKLDQHPLISMTHLKPLDAAL